MLFNLAQLKGAMRRLWRRTTGAAGENSQVIQSSFVVVFYALGGRLVAEICSA